MRPGRLSAILFALVVLPLLAVTLATAGGVQATATTGALPVGSTTATSTPVGSVTPAQTPACGLAWRFVPIPATTYTAYSIDGVSPDDVWAVGSRGFGPNYELFTMHWDGTQWSEVPAPTMGAQSELAAVAAVGTNDVWAVGYTGYRSLIMRWDGTQWSVLSGSASLQGVLLLGVTAINAQDVWAVGYVAQGSNPVQTLTMHWDGTQWSTVPSPNAGASDLLYSVSAVATNDVWAAGYHGSPHETLIEHWDGTQWSVVPSPNEPGSLNELRGVVAVSQTDVWAVGNYQPNYRQGLIEHWDGTQWTSVPAPPNPTGGALFGVAATSSSDVWAVGWHGDQNGVASWTVHWNGTDWSTVPSPSTGRGPSLVGVTALSGSDVWAVGYIFSTSVPALHYSDPCAPTATPSPTATGTSTVTTTVTNTALPTRTPTPVQPTNTPTFTPSHTPTRIPTEVTITPTSTATPCTLSFTDVHPTDYFYTSVLYLACHGAISGYSDGTFRPYNETTRGQLSKIVVLAEGFPIDTAGGPHFTDVPPSNGFYPFVETAYHRGVISGYSDGTFRWGTNVTRGQLSKIVVLAQQWPLDTAGGPHFTDVPATNPFYAYVETVRNRGAISGYSDGTFRPGTNATRGQISKIVYTALTAPQTR